MLFFVIGTQKFRRFCVMVDKSHRVHVDVDGSLKERDWDTEEFYAVLYQHTEQVRILSPFESSIVHETGPNMQ